MKNLINLFIVAFLAIILVQNYRSYKNDLDVQNILYDTLYILENNVIVNIDNELYNTILIDCKEFNISGSNFNVIYLYNHNKAYYERFIYLFHNDIDFDINELRKEYKFTLC